jgi:hypothetical protein
MALAVGVATGSPRGTSVVAGPRPTATAGLPSAKPSPATSSMATRGEVPTSAVEIIVVIALTLIGLLVLAAWVAYHRPRLGTSD